MLLLSIRRAFRAAGLVALSAALAAPAAAVSFYQWETEDGVIAYTDDPKRIPARYKVSARRRTLGQLSAYSRFTPTAEVKPADYGQRLSERLTVLRDVSAPPLSGAAPRSATATGDVHVRIDLPTLEIDVPSSDGAEPVVIEQVRAKRRDGITTRTITIVKQGDRTISIIKPQPNDANSSFPDEEDFE